MRFKTKTIGEVAEVQTGPFGSQLHKEDYVEAGTPIVTVEHLGQRRFSTQNLPRVKDCDRDRLLKYTLKTGDLVFSRVGSVDRISFVTDDENGWMFSGRCLRLRVFGEIDALWLYYFFCLEQTKQFVRNIAVGATMPSINTKLLSEVPVSYPENIADQRKIASILSLIDDKIELNSTINHNLLHQLALTFDQTYVTGRAGTLGELISVIESGSRPRGGAESHGIPSIGAESIEKFGAYDFSKDKYISEQYFASLNRGIVESRDVLLYKDGAYTGKVSMSLDGFPHKKCAVNEHVFILRTLNSRLQFSLYCLMARNDVRNKIYTLASSKAAQPGLNQNELRSVPINIPSESELYKFEQYAEPMMHLIAKNANENKLLANLRDLLLPRIMSGEIDISKVKI